MQERIKKCMAWANINAGIGLMFQSLVSELNFVIFTQGILQFGILSCHLLYTTQFQYSYN